MTRPTRIALEDRQGAARVIDFLEERTQVRLPIADALAALIGTDFASVDRTISRRYHRYRFTGDGLLNGVCGKISAQCLRESDQLSVYKVSVVRNSIIARARYGSIFIAEGFLHEAMTFMQLQADVRGKEPPVEELCGERLEAIAGAMYQHTGDVRLVYRFGERVLRGPFEELLRTGVVTLEERVVAHLLREGVPHTNGATLSFVPGRRADHHETHLLFDGVLIASALGVSRHEAEKRALNRALAYVPEGKQEQKIG